eukprot:scpid30732/ scgid2842/ Fatty acid oxidation complex subunit alpha; Enoyl-CoA hydratase/Delta(3)-cis-Delta(2)-trans-enoyl-CoA isomerase/3-hydroxybutyryl-CoA epimerase; 3-hydroxyacyl-CoA dehydrogenase
MAQSRTIVDVSEVVISLVTIQDDDFPLPVMAVCFDQRGKHNIMSQSFFYCLGYALDVVHRFAREEKISAVVFCSGKSTFCVGADIEYQLEMNSPQVCAEAVMSCQGLINLVEAIAVPTIAVINGLALGGGLELCLACDYRVADWQNGRMGLPEVHVGVLPALGGCVRLPRLIGFKPALKLVLTGRTIRATEAQSIGLVDALLHNSQSKEGERFTYHWIVELSQQWRLGKLGGQLICSTVGPVEKGAKGSAKPGSKLTSNAGKGTARARLMRQNQPAADKAPQRRISYKVGHMQIEVADMKEIRLLNDPTLVQAALAACEDKLKQKYLSRWSCWTHVEQMAVYYGALQRINAESHGIFPAPYLCLLAMLRGWQASSVVDACTLTAEPYTVLALSPEAVSLMSSFLEVRQCSQRAQRFLLPENQLWLSPAEQQSHSQHDNLAIPSRSAACDGSASASPCSDASDVGAANSDQNGGSTVRKRKKTKKKKGSDKPQPAQPSQQQQAAAPQGLTPPLPLRTSNSSANNSRPGSADSNRSLSAFSSSKESVEQVVTFVGDASPHSIALLLQLLVAEVPVFLLAPTTVIAHAVLSRVRLQMNHQLKYGSLTPAMKIARLSHLKGSGDIMQWERWMTACCKDLHKLFWDQRPGSTTSIAHLVLVTSTVDSDTYTLDELVTICNQLSQARSYQSVALRSACVLSSPTSFLQALSVKLAIPSAMLQLQGLGVDNSKVRCLEVTSFRAFSGKSGSLPGTDSWFVRSLSTFLSKIGKTPIVTVMPRCPSISVQVSLMCLEVACRLAVYGGRDLYDTDQIFVSVGFQMSPLQYLTKCGVSSVVRIVHNQVRYRTLYSLLDTVIKNTVDEEHGEEDIKIFNAKGHGIAACLALAVKQCRKALTPSNPALVKVLRSWSHQQCAMACMLACVSEAVRFLDAVEHLPDIDLLLAGGPPCFPISQGGPLFYGDRLGWEEVAKQTESLLTHGLFCGLATYDTWPMAGEALEQHVARKYRPAAYNGSVVQTLFPLRPRGLPVSLGLRGLPAGYGKMPWFSSFDAPIWFCLHLIVFFFIALLVVLWIEVRAGNTLEFRFPWW